MFVGITNSPRDYAWGSTTAIAELLGRSPTGGPEGELWLGTHPGSPASTEDGRLLDVAVGGRLPFLLKVLAADAPLSLQAHPTREQAAEGFARENAAGLAADAARRNYRDPNHKPELIYALSSPFRALCGFRPVAATRELLEPVAADPRFAPLLDRLGGDADLGPVFEWLITRGPGVDELVRAAASASAGRSEPEWATVRLLAARYPGDPGVAISLLLNTVELDPGQALYLPAGNIHAYLDGLGIELMAASDNVLRGGLTPKHVDVPELLRVLDTRPLPLPLLEPARPAPGLTVFRPEPEIADLELAIAAPASESSPTGVEVPLGGRAAILLCLGDEVVLRSTGADGASRVLPRGAALFVRDEPGLTVTGSGTLVVATSAGPVAP